MADLLELTEDGLYCSAGDFYIDPWRPVERALITHAHSDHARWGMKRYLCATECSRVLRLRVDPEANIDTVDYGRTVHVGDVEVSFYPAGHILGSAQIKVERGGEVWVVSGDYKTSADPTCTPFEAVRCHTFITESTFGLPIYRWPAEKDVFAQINDWWRGNQAVGKASLLMGYALGKAQRALAGLDPSIGPIFQHGAVQRFTDVYRSCGVRLPATEKIYEQPRGYDWSKALIIAPPSAQGTTWVRRFGDLSTAFVSGWMAIRGTRRRRAIDRGFVLSDHVDWPALLQTVTDTGAERVWVTHGYASAVARYLQEQGLDAIALPTRWEGEQDDAPENEESTD